MGEGLILFIITSIFIVALELKTGARLKDKTFHYEKGGDEMVIGIALTVLVLGLMFASRLSQGKSAKKYIVWGTTIILIITPFFSCVVSILFSINQGDDFAEVGLMMLSLPLFF